MPVTVRRALPEDVSIVHNMLLEASRWVDALGVVMWDQGELEFERLQAEVAAGLFFIAFVDDDAAGALKFQLDDELFWPDLPQHESAFVHRLVVRREYAGRGISTALLEWAVERAGHLGKSWLRLDCDADRPKLRALYERCGFVFHSFRQVGPYYVARYEHRL